jgi:hypothetical protein
MQCGPRCMPWFACRADCIGSVEIKLLMHTL